MWHKNPAPPVVVTPNCQTNAPAVVVVDQGCTAPPVVSTSPFGMHHHGHHGHHGHHSHHHDDHHSHHHHHHHHGFGHK